MASRGQASTEYLIILAVVIVVALVVVGILGWFPGLGGGIRESASRAYWKAAQPFGIAEYKITTNGNVTLALQNNGEVRANVTKIYMGARMINVGETFEGGETKTITGTLGGPCGSTGDTFSYDVKLMYDTAYITDNQQLGDKPLIGKCI